MLLSYRLVWISTNSKIKIGLSSARHTVRRLKYLFFVALVNERYKPIWRNIIGYKED